MAQSLWQWDIEPVFERKSNSVPPKINTIPEAVTDPSIIKHSYNYLIRADGDGGFSEIFRCVVNGDIYPMQILPVVIRMSEQGSYTVS
jgi:hypothetical protein